MKLMTTLAAGFVTAAVMAITPSQAAQPAPAQPSPTLNIQIDAKSGQAVHKEAFKGRHGFRGGRGFRGHRGFRGSRFRGGRSFSRHRGFSGHHKFRGHRGGKFAKFHHRKFRRF